MKITKTLIAVFLTAFIIFSGCKSKDAEIQASITEKFAATPELTGASATVTNGAAVLSGIAKDEAAKTQAESIAKSVKGVKSVNNQIMVSRPEAVAPAINSDSTLHEGVIDATKDFPGVTATVTDGEITITGNIQRSQLSTLMQSLNTLKPRKINNQLTIK